MTEKNDPEILDELRDRSRVLIGTEITRPEHLKRWLQASGRTWIVFNSLDLVDALPWPHGVDTFMQLVACYRDHRLADNRPETLEVSEMQAVVEDFLVLIHEEDPEWNP